MPVLPELAVEGHPVPCVSVGRGSFCVDRFVCRKPGSMLALVKFARGILSAAIRIAHRKRNQNRVLLSGLPTHLTAIHVHHPDSEPPFLLPLSWPLPARREHI